MFLCRLLCGSDGSLYVKEALASRHSATLEMMKFLEDTIEAQRDKAESIRQVLHGKPSGEGQGTSLQLSLTIYKHHFLLLLARLWNSFVCFQNIRIIEASPVPLMNTYRTYFVF